MQLNQTTEYKTACDALMRLKDALGVTDDLKALAAYVLRSSSASVEGAMFPYVGIGDERDRAIVRVHEEAFHAMLMDEDDPEY